MTEVQLFQLYHTSDVTLTTSQQQSIPDEAISKGGFVT